MFTRTVTGQFRFRVYAPCTHVGMKAARKEPLKVEPGLEISIFRLSFFGIRFYFLAAVVQVVWMVETHPALFLPFVPCE